MLWTDRQKTKTRNHGKHGSMAWRGGVAAWMGIDGDYSSAEESPVAFIELYHPLLFLFFIFLRNIVFFFSRALLSIHANLTLPIQTDRRTSKCVFPVLSRAPFFTLSLITCLHYQATVDWLG